MSDSSKAPSDFDFEFGDWVVHHRRLNKRLANCNEWTEFMGQSSTRPILGGSGNLEDNVLNMPEGRYKAIALRSYDPVKNQWAIWWLDDRNPHHLDVPVVGSFQNGKGLFFADDALDGRPIKIRFTWDTADKDSPRWEQAFSADGGASWETNWTMRFERAS